MSRAELQIAERLGLEGLRRAVDGMLDQTRLARLATLCGVRYPGLRTRSQHRERLLQDILERCGRDAAVRRTVVRFLQREAQPALREWSKLGAEERARRVRVGEQVATDGTLGLHLFLLASRLHGSEDDALLEELRPQVPLAAPAPADPQALERSEREVARLRKQAAELRKKIKHLEDQLGKARENEKLLKKDLVQRKGELAEARMLTEKLRRDLQRLGSAPLQAAPADLGERFAALEGAVRQLARRFARATEESRARAAGSPPEGALGGLREAIESLGARLEQHQSRTASLFTQLVEELRGWRAEIERRLAAEAHAPAPSAPRRRSGKASRLGVFIDVQNVYYGARQLKGKLDFDALLQAVTRDRKLLQATAYVVETKEIDQSGFISLLEQRGITVRRKQLKVRADGPPKGDWDMEMALDILDAAPKLDVVVLVSGDGDFTSLVRRVKAMGPRVEVVGFPRSTAKSLIEAADGFQPLDRKFMIREPRHAPAAPVEAEPPAAPSGEI